jgi:hypothetical protein
MRQYALVQANVRSDNTLASAQVDSSPRPCLRVPPPRCCTPLARLLCAAQRTNVSTGGRTWGTRPLVVSSQLVCRPPLACAGAQSTGPDSTCCCSSTVVMRTHAYAHAHHLRPRYLLAGTDGIERVQHRLPCIQAQVSPVRRPHACPRVYKCEHAPAKELWAESDGWETWAQRRAKAPPHIFSAPLRCCFHSPPLKEHWGACGHQSCECQPTISRHRCAHTWQRYCQRYCIVGPVTPRIA